MEPDAIKNKILEELPGAIVEVTDLTGTKDHYSLSIGSPKFKGMLPIKQHRLVNDILRDELQSGAIHALQLNTYPID